jgi:hypothetical protein
MTAVTRRIAKLENQLGTSEGTLRILFEVCHAGTTQADMDPDIQILRHVDFGRLEPPSGQTQAQRRQQRRCKFGGRRE